MVNYNLGKIYKIEALNGEEGDVYIGSTVQPNLGRRMAKHRDCYKMWKKQKTGKTMSYILFDKYGVENCKIILLELVNANSNDELKAREAYYIKTLSCINKQVPLRNRNEWYEDNKEILAEKRKVYKEVNKEVIATKRAYKYQEHKEIMLEKNKKYYEANKESILNTMSIKKSCICGSIYCGSPKRHERSLKHQTYVSTVTKN